MATVTLLRELASRLGVDHDTMSAGDKARALAVLDDAAVAVAAHTGWDPGKRDEWHPVGRMILLSVARRVYSNPHGYVSESAGEYTITRSTVNAHGDVTLSYGERQQLSRLVGRTGLGSIRVGR